MWVGRGYVRRLLRQIERLERELQEERERARRREDALIDSVLTAAGRYALPSDPKARYERPPVEPPVTAIDEARLLALRDAAVRAGRPASDGDRMWKAQRNGQPVTVGLPDEPYILPQ